MSNRFTEKAEKALNNAAKIAENHGHTYIGSEHILLSLSKEEHSSAAIILLKYGISAQKIANAVKDYSGIGAKSNLTPKDMTPSCKRIVENSYKISTRYSSQKIGTEHILLAVLEERECVGTKLLSLVGGDISGITEELQTLLRSAQKNYERIQDGKDAKNSLLEQYGKNLTALARAGKIDPVIGRDKETERLIRILSRKNKNNPCLIGEAGVGKTAIVEGLANRIAAGTVPESLRCKEIITVDLTSMVSGTKYRGDFEERIKAMLLEASKNKTVLLFIDEVHTIVGAGAAEGAIDAANILKPQLSRGEIQLIGATTFSEYHKYIERDAALERRFQPITVNESSPSEALEILTGLKKRYEEHHRVKISDEAIKAAVEYSVRYIQDRYLPDKALDVLDEACAKVNTETSANREKDVYHREKSEQNLLSSGYKSNGYRRTDIDEICAEELLYNSFANSPQCDESFDFIETVTKENVKEIINEMTGIPIVGIGQSYDFLTLVNKLNQRVIGQEEAVKSVAEAVLRSETGISSPERPKGVFLFIGPSGVGKTELARALSEELFYDKNSLFSFDMSEFSEKNSVNKLIGSPPGYVGFEEGGALTEKIRRRPYSIVLFDEIEKAHGDVLDLLLQIADKGVLSDSGGRIVSFRNTYIILTSNIGANKLKMTGLGFGANSNSDKRNQTISELENHFRTELLGRIDDIILFPPISYESMLKIAKIKLSELSERLKQLNIEIEIKDGVAELLTERSIDTKFGVRRLIRLITAEIENRISAIMINEKTDKTVKFKIGVNEKEFTVRALNQDLKV